MRKQHFCGFCALALWMCCMGRRLAGTSRSEQDDTEQRVGERIRLILSEIQHITNA